jgi:low temperature requirement protein LtrA
VHVLIVGGIIACAVSDELVIAHPEHGEPLGLAIVLGGPILYLIGNATFKWITNDRRGPPLSHLVGLGLLGLLAWPTATHALTPLHLAVLANGALLVVAIWESLAVRKVVGTEALLGDE